MLLGCIADDFTGATDLANTLVRRGMRTVQLIGLPDTSLVLPDAHAVVVALKSRTVPASEAVALSLQALEWLRARDCRQFFFKYCSTFDSTPAGNIGPVADALLDALGCEFAIACPAFPETGRTIFKGYLFVGDVLLNESGMQDHPLTPMTDANLVRVLQAQTRSRVGLVPHEVVERGPDAIVSRFASLASDQGCRFAIVDALRDQHLKSIGTALAGQALVTGGSGVALGLPENFRRQGLLEPNDAADALPRIEGPAAVLAGSCSQATLGQVEDMRGRCPAFKIDALAVAAGDDVAGQALEMCRQNLDSGPVLVYASAPPEDVKKVQTELGRDRAGKLIEKTMARIATGLVEHGVRKLIVAGGETAGAVVNALGVRGLRIGPQIDPGVPWTQSIGDPALALALKSGNFGTRDFFLKALDRLA